MFIRDFLYPKHLILLLLLVLVMGALVLAIVLMIRAVSRSGQRQQPQQGGYPPSLYGQPPTYYPALTPSESDPATTLARAKTMLDQGLISQAEYDDTKRHVLAKMQR